MCDHEAQRKDNCLVEVPDPEVSCKFLTARIPLIWELLA